MAGVSAKRLVPLTVNLLSLMFLDERLRVGRHLERNRSLL